MLISGLMSSLAIMTGVVQGEAVLYLILSVAIAAVLVTSVRMFTDE